ncbi:hypothetical protein OIU34_21665 [Pararhizobium sp. BT-229]|uniref:hypothetical protein n=1 Tax=Pararhizobium sp. BT-229 TaxID=2986923 RepID=UPI0021F6DEA3|nr:hypothetical protein [Pararhizobium sp. BT-229]MCV9964501.1 hypothetical protein [Pararhizobium sp. BT-229]
MPKLIAVIHYLDDATSIKNADVVAAAGYDGVCLIHMNGQDDLIEDAAVAIKQRHPGLLVITNRLSMHPADMVRRDAELGLDGSWADNPGVSSRGITPLASEIEDTVFKVRESKPDFLFFGSVAFKTQPHDPDPATAAVKAKNLGWIATTSGSATGVAPEEDKLERMKTAIASFDLAVASGITPENAGTLCEHADWVLVSTGISATFYDFDPLKAAALRAAAPRD